MTCDDVQLEVVTQAEPRSAQVSEHLARCAACQAFARDAATVLSLATLPEPTAAERARLATLPVTVHAAWRAAELHRTQRVGWLRMAVAAGVGALAASAVLLTTRAPVVTEHVAPPQTVYVAAADSAPDWSEDLNLSEDDVFDEVSWPSDSEGDTP